MDELRVAGCILLNEKGEVLLLHRNTEKYNHWEIPGGKIETGESEEAAAIREIQEELGVAVKIGRKLGDATFFDGKTVRYHWFLASTNETPKVCEPDKFEELAYFPFDGFSELALSEGAKTFASLVDSGKIRL